MRCVGPCRVIFPFDHPEPVRTSGGCHESLLTFRLSARYLIVHNHKDGALTRQHHLFLTFLHLFHLSSLFVRLFPSSVIIKASRSPFVIVVRATAFLNLQTQPRLRLDMMERDDQPVVPNVSAQCFVHIPLIHVLFTAPPLAQSVNHPTAKLYPQEARYYYDPNSHSIE